MYAFILFFLSFYIKFIIIVNLSYTLLWDEIREMFQKLHTNYTQLMSDPFYIPGNPISSPKFSTVVQSILANPIAGSK